MNTNVAIAPELADVGRSSGPAIVTPPRRLMLRLRLQIALIFIDAGAVLAGIAAASLIWFGSVTYPGAEAIYAALCPLYLVLALNGGAFQADTLVSYRHGAFRALRALCYSCMLLVLAAYFLKIGEHISRMALLISGLAGCANLTVARMLVPFVVRHGRGVTLRSEILIADAVECDVPPGMFLVDAHEAGLECDLRNPFMLDRLGRMLRSADRVVIACPPDRRRRWAMMLKGANIQGEIMAPELDDLGPLGTGQMADVTTLTVSTGSLGLQQRMVKRSLDLALCCFALVATAPLLLIVALAIKLDSHGPVFFVQQRVGRGNQLFPMIKFRSMRVEASDQAGARSTGRSDDRITRVGKFIRATSVDELPQLLNVLTGDMSIVGPRPHALGSLAGDALFWEVDERYWHRHSCKPGLTGLAQVRGLRGATHHRSDLINRLQADLEYNADWTIWKDVAILFATLRVVVHRNAY